MNTVKLEAPLLLSLLKYARNESTTSEDLERIINNAQELSNMAGVLGSMDLETVIGPREALDEIKLWQHRAGIKR